MDTRTVVVTNFKGGTGKTTTAAYLAHSWLERGSRVLYVDADPQASGLRWSEAAEWPFPAVGMPVNKLHQKLPGITGNMFDLVVIDTPPMEEHRGIVLSCLRAADIVVIPMAPSTIELDRLPSVLHELEEVAPLRESDPEVMILLNRVHPTANSGPTVRETLTGRGLHVIGAQLVQRESYRLAFGRPIQPLPEVHQAALEVLGG
jgi:chromosome partitioning protein